ncbi:CPBP family intramembrane glutamic endopeptidase [Butyrivibrio sp. M55]|uniref:CPBP family intramembrane glutamic endopeptidase n=1 Tax=Butyrivibrio sp. M55 TaxID=1855323 RepID=UPI0008ED6F29|nr:CPBP family intramembrane glutamic endopeptidase [Butyrivibrio sp. M55]SFU81720.1 Membrane protease YdiL, CAAX protease family [Butyrivibrio sp. M55]
MEELRKEDKENNVANRQPYGMSRELSSSGRLFYIYAKVMLTYHVSRSITYYVRHSMTVIVTQEENKMKTVKYLLGIIVTIALALVASAYIPGIFGRIALILILVLSVIIFGHKEVFAFSFKSFKDTFVIGGVMTAVTAFYLITNLYKSFTEYGTPLMDSKLVVSFFITMFIGAGISEELIARGFLFTFLRNAFGNNKASYIVAMALSSIFFGALHFTNLDGAVDPTPIYAQIIYAVGIGFFLAALYIRTGNLWGNMVLHYLFDISLMIYPMVFANRSDMDVLIGEWLGNGIIIKSILICVVSVILGLYLIRDSKLQPIIDAENVIQEKAA